MSRRWSRVAVELFTLFSTRAVVCSGDLRTADRGWKEEEKGKSEV